MAHRDAEKLRDMLYMANKAKDRLADLAEKLEAAGYERKARSCMTLVYQI